MHAWKDIPEFPNYEICKSGLVRKKQLVAKGNGELMLSLTPGAAGYLGVKLKHESGIWKRVKVHVLVMRVFVSPRPEGLVINHIDGNKTNNNLENLEYCTQTENERHSLTVLGKIHNRDKYGRFTRASSS